jgi:hypothetical protein
MTTDRYTKSVLTVIAGALIYLCIVMTPFPGVQAQGMKRPGEFGGPAEMVIVGWKTDPLPITATRPLPIVASEPVRVITERSAGAADRVVLVGWEPSAIREKPGRMQTLSNTTPVAGVPVQVVQQP